MELFHRVALKYFDADGDGRLNDRETAELDRVFKLNDLSLSDFLALPQRDRGAAEELWTAQVLDLNVKLQKEQAAVVRKQLAIYHPEFG
jgi:hypothetical protein